MTIIQLLHLSDLHLASKPRHLVKFFPSKYNAYCTEEIARISLDLAKENKIDAILITGDIANTGDEQDLKLAYDYFASDFQRDFEGKRYLNAENKPTLKAFNKPIMILPGNHDRYDGIALLPGNKAFNTIFNSYWNPQKDYIAVHYLPNPNTAKAGIICADFSLKKVEVPPKPPLYHLGQGHVYKERLEELENITISLKNKGIAPLWAIHFTPYLEKYSDDRLIKIGSLKLWHSHRIINKAEELGINLILCGHAHERHLFYEGSNKKILIQCASSSTCKTSKKKPEIYHIKLLISHNQIVRIKTKPFIWDGEKFDEEKGE